MKHILVIISGLIVAAPAFGADLAIPGTTGPLQVRTVHGPYFWTGCYIGAQAGYGFGQQDFADPSGTGFAPAGATVHDSTGGGIAGGRIGCDYQFHGNFVIGTVADFGWADIAHNVSDPFAAGGGAANINARTNQLGSVTARFGYALDQMLVYAKGGGAWAHDLYAVNLPSGALAGAYGGSATPGGWTAGAGVEWAFLPTASAYVEFDYYDLGNSATNLGAGAGTLAANVKQQFETLTVGINYRFSVVVDP